MGERVKRHVDAFYQWQFFNIKGGRTVGEFPNTITVSTFRIPLSSPLPTLFAVLSSPLSISSMAPRTRRSQTKGTAVGTPSTENERFIPLEGSTAANINMSTQSKVPARRVVPGSALHHQPGMSTLNCAVRLSLIF